VADAFAGVVIESPYFGNYERWPVPWQLAEGEVDGEPAIIIMLREETGRFGPRGAIRLDVVNGRITRIVDYIHCPSVLQSATSVIVSPPRLIDCPCPSIPAEPGTVLVSSSRFEKRRRSRP